MLTWTPASWGKIDSLHFASLFIIEQAMNLRKSKNSRGFWYNNDMI